MHICIDCDRIWSPAPETIYEGRLWIEVVPCLLTFFEWYCYLCILCFLRLFNNGCAIFKNCKFSWEFNTPSFRRRLSTSESNLNAIISPTNFAAHNIPSLAETQPHHLIACSWSWCVMIGQTCRVGCSGCRSSVGMQG